jgi:hypothetical protein
MKVLVACEFSGIVRDAFAARGHDAWSCDLLPSERPGKHYIGDIGIFLGKRKTPMFDLMISFPPCTHLAVSGARWFKGREAEQEHAIIFAHWLLDGPYIRIRRRAIENPVGVLSRRIRPPDQIIQPWQFGHPETKATCLWLNNLPPLCPTNIVEGRKARVHHESPGRDRWRRRSRTYQGIADAMAEQWGNLEPAQEGERG